MSKVSTKSVASKSAKAVVENPYRPGSNYHAAVAALASLGLGKQHQQAAVIAAVKKEMGDNWKAFANKDARNEATAKDAEGKAWVNVSVVARKDYGFPLNALGFMVKFDGKEKTAGIYRCPKATEKPERQARKAEKPQKQAAAVKVAPKAAKAMSKPQKPSKAKGKAKASAKAK